jgi:hypothetical protein
MKSGTGAPKDAKLSPPPEVSTRVAYRRSRRKPARESALGIRCALPRAEDLTNRCGKIIHARAGHNDRVSPPMRFLSDAKKFPAIVLAEFDVETLPLDLEFFCFDDAIHFRKRRSLGLLPLQMEANSRGTCSAKRLTAAPSNGGGLAGESGPAHCAAFSAPPLPRSQNRPAA